MTTPNINAAGAMAAGAHEITSGKAKGKAEGQSFMDIMNLADTSGRVNAESSVADLKASRTRQNTPEPQKKEANQIEPKDTGDKNGAVDNKDAKGSRDIRETQETGKTEVSKNNDESNGSDSKITEAAGDVKEAIEAELGISDEEMDQLLEVMGLTTVDLLDPKVITDIVAQVKDVTPVDIVSNEELTDIVSSLQGKVREITSGVMQETDMTMEDFKNAIAEIKKQETGNEVVSGKPREDVRAFDQKILTEDGKELQNTVRTPAEAVSPERADDHQGRTGRISDEREVSLDVSVKNENAVQDQMDQTDQNSEASQNDFFRSQDRAERQIRGDVRNSTANNNIFFQNLTNAVENTLEAVTGNQAQSLTQGTTMADAMELIEQISSQVRAVVESETQSLAMQLHPQSLGRLNIELVSKGGQITAQFEAENASVKAALEGHIAELKQSLEQRGLRVENVEVSVATHEFEQNLMGGQQSENMQQEAGRRPRTRRINLNDIDDIEGFSGEEPDEGERIAKEMMAADGNSVDYMA